MVLCLFVVASLSSEAFHFLDPVLPEPDSETLFFFWDVSLSALVFLFPLLTETSLDSELLLLSIREKNQVNHQLVDCL